VTHKSERIAELVEGCRGNGLEARYLGYFQCFNRQLYFEAHEVLEDLWLEQRGTANARFYQGLIQLAGAFVHLQKIRPGPAAALFQLAIDNLQKYPATHERLNVAGLLARLQDWRARLLSGDCKDATTDAVGRPEFSFQGGLERIELGERAMHNEPATIPLNGPSTGPVTS